MSKEVCGNTFISLYGDDVEMDLLVKQLKLLSSLLKQTSGDLQTGIADIMRAIGKMQRGKCTLLLEVVEVVVLIKLAPATNAKSETVFSGLKRVKTYLRSTMGQA